MSKQLCYLFILILISFISRAEQYQRNKAIPVEKVLFGEILSVRNISERELQEDKKNGWKTFRGAILGGVIGNQFGSGSGRDIATILGVLVGASISDSNQPRYQEKIYHLVELMIKVEGGQEYMIVQERDPKMIFAPKDEIRMVFLANGSVRIDKQM